MKNHSRIMYIEYKGGGDEGNKELSGPARIGGVTFSKTGKTIKYAGKEFQSLKGSGYKSNYYDVETGAEYWISGCKKDGGDALYGGIIEVDDDAREEYWTSIRNLPQNIEMSNFSSQGKY